MGSTLIAHMGRAPTPFEALCRALPKNILVDQSVLVAAPQNLCSHKGVRNTSKQIAS